MLPRRSTAPSPALVPPLVYGHLSGTPERRGGRWRNRGEAEAIAGWLMRRRKDIEGWAGGRGIGDVVGVVTPFAAQAACLRAAMKDAGLGGVVCGTVHAFQGSQRPIIVLSMTTGREAGGTWAMDRGSNLLNVAVSRAEDAVLVVGDMGMLDAAVETPSGVLARHLFAREDNDVGGFAGFRVAAAGRRGGLERLADLEAHRTLLRAVMEREARRRVLVVSPWLSMRALDADGIVERMAAARRRGVEVVVVCDAGFTEGRPEAGEAMAAMRASGVDVRRLGGVHTKTLAWDRDGICEGSFNWLSAVRDAGHRWSQHEASFAYRGDGVAGLVAEAWREVERLGSKGDGAARCQAARGRPRYAGRGTAVVGMLDV